MTDIETQWPAWLQAGATVVLVAVTIFYAKRTSTMARATERLAMFAVAPTAYFDRRIFENKMEVTLYITNPSPHAAMVDSGSIQFEDGSQLDPVGPRMVETGSTQIGTFADYTESQWMELLEQAPVWVLKYRDGIGNQFVSERKVDFDGEVTFHNVYLVDEKGKRVLLTAAAKPERKSLSRTIRALWNEAKSLKDKWS